MRVPVLVLLSLLAVASGSSLAEEVPPPDPSRAVLEAVQACTAAPAEEGERLGQKGMAILETGDGGFGEAVRALEAARDVFERAVLCFDVDAAAEASLSEQDREFLTTVRGTMREGVDRIGTLLPLVTSHDVVNTYLSRCRKKLSLDASVSYEKAISMRERKTGSAAEIRALLDAADTKIDEVEGCVLSLVPFAEKLSNPSRVAAARAINAAKELRNRVAAAREAL